MRLRRLHVHRYGHFTEASLDFVGNGLQVIHGHNEAGKSTLLQFVREILFGFAVQNRYAFGGEKLEGSALLEFANQSRLELRRRKGRPDNLTAKRDNGPPEFSQAELQQLLGGASDSLYQNVFAFGLDELAKGEESLRIDAVQHALHGSGVGGLTHPQKMLDQLARESESIFKERGSRQEIAAICSDIKKHGTELKAKITKTETYLQRKREHDVARDEAERLAGQLSQLRREYAQVKKLATAFPIWRELADLREQRTSLGAVSPLAADSRQKFDKLQDELKRLLKTSATLERDIQHNEAELQKNPAQNEWLNLRSQIERARELIKSVEEARRDLPLLQAELHSNQQQVRHGIEDVISSWTVRHLEDFRCDAGQRRRCEQLAETKRELDNEAIRLTEREATLSKERSETQADLAAIGEIADVTALQTLLNSHADQVAREAELTRLAKEQSKQQRALTTLLRKLSPPLPVGILQVETLPVPPVEQIKHYQLQFAETRKRVTIAEQSLAEALERLQQQTRELAAARGSLQEIPTQHGLRDIRAQRDATWQQVRLRLVTGPAPREPASTGNTDESLPADFERTLADADNYADKMFGNATLVHQQEQVDQSQLAWAAKQDELAAQLATLDKLHEQWRTLWQPCGFEPFDPETMTTWKSQHDQALELIGKLADVQDEITRLQSDSQAFAARLTLALPEFQGGPEQRLEAAQQRVAHCQQQAQELKTCQRQAVRLEKSTEQLAEEQKSLGLRRSEFLRDWQSWLAAQDFPGDWQPDLAITVISRLQSLRDKLQQIPGLENRITAMSQRLAEFDPFVLELCEQVAPDWKLQPTEVAARHLADRLQAAISTDQRRSELSRELQKHRQKLDEIQQQQLLLHGERDKLLQLAQATTDEQFLSEAQRAEQIRDLEQQIAAKERELTRLREFEEEAEFSQQLQAVDYPALNASRQGLEDRISELEDRERQANELKGATGLALDQLDGSAAAAEIQSAITERRAALANAVDRYVPLLFARQLLQQTLQRFEKESQPEMLGEVSRLFAAMTGGRYQRVERPRDTNRPLIVYRGDNSDNLEPDQLSTGTREQLYLAIRLAYVLHYCTKAEPLPIVLDDVLANFDPVRTRRTLEALGQITDRVQVLLFTCHPHVAELAQEVFPDLQPIAVPSSNVVKV